MRRVDPVMWELVEPLIYDGQVDTWIVPRGYRTDFASVPWFVQWFVARTGAWTLAAVLHDWLITDGIPRGLISSRDTDGVFRRVMREQGVGPVRRWLMWCGVRLAAPLNRGRRPSQILLDAPALLGLVLVTLAGTTLFLGALRALLNFVFGSL